MSHDTHKLGPSGTVPSRGSDDHMHDFREEQDVHEDELSGEELGGGDEGEPDAQGPEDGLAAYEGSEVEAEARQIDTEDDAALLLSEGEDESDDEGEDAANQSDAEYLVDTAEDNAEDYEHAEDAPAIKANRWPAVLAWLLALGWTGAFAYIYGPVMQSGAAPGVWVRWIVQWSTPLTLIGVGWLVVMRSSRKEAERYSRMARSLRAESENLETRLAGMNRELKLARDFIATQAEELEQLGRIASERISAHAADLHDMVRVNTARVETIASESRSAAEHMGQIKQDLPHINSSAQALTTNIQTVGDTASQKLTELSGGFAELGLRGEQSEEQITTLCAQLDAALASIAQQGEHIDAITKSRLASLVEQAAAMRNDLAQHEDDAAEAMRSRIAAWDAMLGETRAAQEQAEQSALAALQGRIDTIRSDAETLASAMQDSEANALDNWDSRVTALNDAIATTGEDIARLDALSEESARNRLAAFADQAAALDASLQERYETQQAQANAFAALGEDILKKFNALRGDMKAIATQGHEVESGLAMGMELLASKLRESRLALDTTGDTVSELRRSAESLLGTIEASTRAGQEELRAALTAASEHAAAVRSDVNESEAQMAQARQHGLDLSESVIAAQNGAAQSIADLDALQSRFAEASSAHQQAIARLGDELAALHDQSDSLVQKTEGELAEALETLRQSTRKAIESLENDTHTRVSVLGGTIGARAAEEIQRAVEAQANSSLAELETRAAQAAGLGQDAAGQLREQLARVNDLASNLESRINQAREAAEEKTNSDFSRRIAALNESLNSNGIDIAKALSADVSDGEWGNYLSGDHSVFVRRAVQLIDAGEAGNIADIFDRDVRFREHVSRYIHDFETMLRAMLSTSDGHALGVTLLSSDVGKLYVVLAQATERLRG